MRLLSEIKKGTTGEPNSPVKGPVLLDISRIALDPFLEVTINCRSIINAKMTNVKERSGSGDLSVQALQPC